MIEVTILIPVASNDGDIFAAPHHAQWERFLAERFGGFTRVAGFNSGGWVDEATGRYYSDRTIVYVVAVEGLVGGSGGGNLREAVSFAKDHYQQEAIFLRYLGVAEII